MPLNSKKPMRPEDAKPLLASRIAKALGLEGKSILSISITAFAGGVTIVGASFSLEPDSEGEVAEILKDYVLVERDAETGDVVLLGGPIKPGSMRPPGSCPTPARRTTARPRRPNVR